MEWIGTNMKLFIQELEDNLMKKIFIILLLFIIGLSSCGDVYTHYSLIVDNQSMDTIIIIFSGKSPYIMINPDSLIFYPKHDKVLFETEGRAMKDGCYTGIKENEINIFALSGKKLQKDIWNVNNWNCSGSYKNDWKMTFIITDDDLLKGTSKNSLFFQCIFL